MSVVGRYNNSEVLSFDGALVLRGTRCNVSYTLLFDWLLKMYGICNSCAMEMDFDGKRHVVYAIEEIPRPCNLKYDSEKIADVVALGAIAGARKITMSNFARCGDDLMVINVQPRHTTEYELAFESLFINVPLYDRIIDVNDRICKQKRVNRAQDLWETLSSAIMEYDPDYNPDHLHLIRKGCSLYS